MKYGIYTDLFVTDDYLEFHFTSLGPKGAIPKLIQLTPIQDEETVNLAFGNKKEDGSIDDLARDNNKDRNKILATVVFILKIFFKVYPEKYVFFTGSSPERTRLYRMAIALNYEELAADFEIFGLLGDKNVFVEVSFQKGLDYFGFLVRKKILILGV